MLVLAMAVLQFFNGNYENVFLCILTLMLLLAPAFIQVRFRIELLQCWSHRARVRVLVRDSWRDQFVL